MEVKDFQSSNLLTNVKHIFFTKATNKTLQVSVHANVFYFNAILEFRSLKFLRNVTFYY